MPSALVTGGASRVGRAVVLELARGGFDVLVHANSSLDAAATTAGEVERMGRRAWVVRADLAREEGQRELAARSREHVSALDLLVHNAAAYEHTPFEQITRAAFDRMMAVNVAAPFFLTQSVLPLLRAAAQACIVTVTDASLRHAYSPMHAFSHYIASKAALEQLTRAWAVELGPRIRVNAVAPGAVAIGAATSDEERRELLRRTPLAREGTCEDVAKAVAYLASAPFVTGHVLAVDGGLGAS